MTDRSERKRDRRVTLTDVARHAAVSRALVSIVMRDVPGASSETRARVLASARELGYRPDLRARALAGQKSRLIGVMFGVGVGEFHFELLDGLYDAAEVHGHTLLLSALTFDRDERRAAQSLSDFQFDALIMLTQTMEPILAGTVPVVTVGWRSDHPGVDVVRTSDDHGLALAVGHLVELGHRRISHLDGGPTIIGASRREAYLSAMRDHGLTAEIHVVEGGQSHLDGYRAARALLDEDRELPTAIVAYNDDVAMAAMGVLAHEGVRVPEEISMIGFDDSRAAAAPAVSLTSVVQDTDALALAAVSRAVARIEGRPVEGREIVLQPQLMVRTSTQLVSNTR